MTQASLLAPTRRALLHQLAAAGGTPLLLAGMSALGFGIGSAAAAPPPLTGGAKGKSVVVLGSGVAGLTSAYELSRAGYQVSLLEGRDRVGGRSYTARQGTRLTELGGEEQVCGFDAGLYINPGPWRIPYHHRGYLHYARTLGVPLELFNNDNDHSFVFFDKGSGPLSGKRVRKQEVAADLRGYAAEILAKQARQGALDQRMGAEDRELLIAYLVNEGWLNKTDLSYEGTANRGYVTPPGAGVDPGPGVESKPYALSDLLHSHTWGVLNSVAEYTQQHTMFQPAGGMDRLPAAFAAKLGPIIRTGCVVEKIGQSPDRVEVAYRGADGRRATVVADYCVCTIPLSVLKNIEMQVQPAFKEAMSGVSYAPVGKIGLQMKRRFWEEDEAIYGGHVYFDDPDIGSISFPSTGWQGQKGVLLGYYQFGIHAAKVSALSLKDRQALAVAAGQKVFPQYAESTESSFSIAWHRVPFNLGGWAEWSDEGRKTAYPTLCQPDGRIYLAGEHLSYIGGWQEGGIESAWQQTSKLHARVHA